MQLVYGIDVVNEAVDDQTGNLRDTLYLRKLGKDYLIQAYSWVREVFESEVKLIYNDYNMEYGGAKHRGVLELVQELKCKGFIDEVGI